MKRLSYVQCADIEKCCRLEADFSVADVSSLKRNPLKKGGKPCYKIPYILRLSVIGVKTHWELLVHVSGVVTNGQRINIAAALKPYKAGSRSGIQPGHNGNRAR